MQCTRCGTELAEEALLCPQCGKVVETAQALKERHKGNLMSKKEFYQLPGMKSCRGNITGCAIMTYICAFMTFLVAMDWADYTDRIPFFAITIGTLLALGLWLQLGKSRLCALLILVYGVVELVISVKDLGRVSWLLLLIGVDAVIYTFKFQKLWSQYRKTGDVPDGAIMER